MDDLYDVICKLPKRQRDVLVQIVLDNDSYHHQRTLKALEDRGLIVGSEETLGGRVQVKVRRYYAPIRVQMAVCSWCSKFASDDSAD